MTCAEVIAIGDELTSGLRLDTNSQWLSQKLEELGIQVLYHSTVGDELDANVRVFREAIRRADLVVCTGGLGPTADDLTRPAMALATDRELVQYDDALATIRAMFARRKRDMPERNVAQAMFPAGSLVVPNPHGTAPGIDLTVTREDGSPCRIFALPGVPAEMKEMWQETLESAISTMAGGGRVIRHRQVKCFGIGESDLEQMLPDLVRRGHEPRVGITVSRATITLRVTAAAATAEACEALMAPTIETIYTCLGELVFGEEDDELQHTVLRLLASQRQTLSVVECGSGGLLAHWLSDGDAGAEHFKGGLVLRGESQYQSWVPGELVTENGPYSKELALALAQRCRAEFGTDFAIAISEFPASDANGGTPGRVALAVDGPQGSATQDLPFAGHPEILKPRAAKQALNLLRKQLISQS